MSVCIHVCLSGQYKLNLYDCLHQPVLGACLYRLHMTKATTIKHRVQNPRRVTKPKSIASNTHVQIRPRIIGASLSEPHIDEKYMRDFYIYIYIYSTSVTRAPPYTKHIGRMKYLAMKNPRQEKSIADHVDVCDRDQASQRYTADRCYHVV